MQIFFFNINTVCFYTYIYIYIHTYVYKYICMYMCTFHLYNCLLIEQLYTLENRHSQLNLSGSAGRNPNAEWEKQIFIEAQVQGGAQSWNYSKQQERTKPPEVDSLESSPSRYQWKIICTRLGWQTAWGNQQAGSLRLVEQDWREHTTRQHAKLHKKHVIKGKE